MPAILIKLLPYLLALGLFGLWTHHERSVQRTKDLAADAKQVALQAQLDVAVQAQAANATIGNQQDFSHAISQAVTNAPVPSRLCSFALGSRAVPVAPGSDASGNASAGLPGTDQRDPAEVLRDFANELSTVGRDASAQVKALQADDQTLRTEMEKSNGIVIHPK
jgi:hypothetical protein